VSDDQELDGNTLRIYVALANADKSLGPREITRIVHLSSPSVAYRNLQKLEELGLIEKDAFGGYTVTQKQRVKGHFWVGGRLLPRPLFYAFFFIGILSVEVAIAIMRLIDGEQSPSDFVLLLIVTVTSTVLFLLEWILSIMSEGKKQRGKTAVTSEDLKKIRHKPKLN
jgi:hypothetical protein